MGVVVAVAAAAVAVAAAGCGVGVDVGGCDENGLVDFLCLSRRVFS